MAPSEFWELSPTEFWWEFDAKVRAVKRLQAVSPGPKKPKVDWEAARAKHKEKMERLRNGDRNQ